VGGGRNGISAERAHHLNEQRTTVGLRKILKEMILPGIILGFMGSLHCLGMCGPIAFMLPVDRKNHLRGSLQVGAYHLGRVMAYTVIGLLFGILGKGLGVFGIQQKLSVIIGLLMILSVLLPLKNSYGQRALKPVYRLISRIKSRLGKELGRQGPDTFLTIGFLNGLLPCGLVYMAVLGSFAMGNPLESSLFMTAFGLGTIPLMSSAVYFGNFAKASLRQRMKRMIPAVVIFIGILFILRGMGLGVPYLSPAPASQIGAVFLECHP
jgi:hypothetical protein